jgi:hypothetical protein
MLAGRGFGSDAAVQAVIATCVSIAAVRRSWPALEDFVGDILIESGEFKVAAEGARD